MDWIKLQLMRHSYDEESVINICWDSFDDDDGDDEGDVDVDGVIMDPMRASLH